MQGSVVISVNLHRSVLTQSTSSCGSVVVDAFSREGIGAIFQHPAQID